MTYDEALLRLLNHANLPDSHTEMLLRDASFIFVLYKVDQERILVDFKPLFEDVIACLEVVNRKLNGNIPSQTITGKVNDIPRSLSYAIALIITDGLGYYQRWIEKDLFDPMIRDRLAQMIWCIAHAWNQLLAGDIDNLRKDIEENLWEPN